MVETVSVSEASRHFSGVLQGVREGNTYLITSNGQPIAKIIPIGSNNRAAETARTQLIARLRELPLAHLGDFSRAQAYDDAE